MKSGTTLLAVLLMVPWTSSSQVFRSGVEGVRIDVLVTDGRTPIVGLTAEDFELRDNGVVQEISAVTMEDVPLSVIIAADTSASMAGVRLRELKDAAHAAVTVLRPEDRVAVVGFSHAVRLKEGWTSDRPTIAAAIDSLVAEGGTALNHAICFTLVYRDLNPTRALGIVFSDGIDTASALTGASVLDLSQRADVVVYGVVLADPRKPLAVAPDYSSGIELTPPRVGPSVLEAISKETGGRFLRTERGVDLRAVFLAVVNEFKSRYVLTYSPRNVASGGWHAVDVRLKHRRARVVARRGYTS